MADEEPDDRIIRERKFKRSTGIGIIDIEHNPSTKEEEGSEQVDEAIGDVFDPFIDKGSRTPGAVQSDGTVSSSPERDIVTDLALEGERRVNWILMASMVIVYSAISIQIGRTFDPLVGTIALLILATIGFVLGEYWVPKEGMVLLGVTWVIISMKVLYGLAIELRQWGVIESDLVLGISLLLLVGLNVYVSYRHDQDAIAAQSTLVLLAIGSTAGTEFGENGVAAMILLATILVHGLALNRKSGNLASLGIASSNLWIGMHALTSGFEVGQLRVLPLDSPLLLFLLLMTVTVLNAIMAARFAREENWFSKGFETLGLGRPGLWGVSISLGMVGAVLAVASNRDDVGYALGMITFLGGAFGGSYLVVRGVGGRRVALPLVSSGLILTTILLLGDLVHESLGVSSYHVFTVLGAITTGAVILRDQNSVSDRVLWVGSLAILGILVILVPTKMSDSGGDGGALLLGLLAVLHIGTAVLALSRESPSLAGVTVLLPWSWMLIEEIVQETYRTIMLANEMSDPGGLVELDPAPLAIYLGISCLLLYVVNTRMGENGVNLASRFLGVSEVSSSIRDSGVLQLWSIGLWLPSLTILFLAQFGGFDSVTIVAIVSLLAITHSLACIKGLRAGGGGGIMCAVAIIAVVVQWRHGLDQSMMAILCITVGFLIRFGEDEFSLGMGLASLPVLVAIVDRQGSATLSHPDWLPFEIDDLPSPNAEVMAVVCLAVLLAIYLPKSDKLEKILPAAASSLVLIILTTLLALKSEESGVIAASVSMFAITSVWLIAKGELRSELKTMAKRDNILKDASLGLPENDVLSEGSVGSYNPKMAELSEIRKKSRHLSESAEIDELLTTDISHRPIVGLFVLAVALTTTTIFGALFGSRQEIWPLFLLAGGGFSLLIVLLIRNRTRGLELNLPHTLGIEMPIAFTILGLGTALVTAHVISPGSSNQTLLDLAVLTILILLLVMVSLVHQRNLQERIAIAIDWFVLSLLSVRVLGAMLGGGLPMPLSVDPFEGDLVDWKLPWILQEVLLILCVIVSFWLDERRGQLGRDDHASGSVIGARSFAIVLLSFGIAGVLAAASGCYRSWKTLEPTGLGLSLPAAVAALIAMASWREGLWDLMYEMILAFGLILILACVLTVPLNMEKWTMTLAADGHLFVVSGALGMGLLVQIEMPMLLVAMSTSVWVVGILQLRKALRIWGLAELVAAVLCSLIFVTNEISEPENLLIGLVVLALELGIVAWLGSARQEDMVRD